MFSAATNITTSAQKGIHALRLPPWDAIIKNLSGGEKRRVALCKLLLDEPTNHLDAESVEWLEQSLVRFPGTVVAVTHDRYFLDNAAEWILELDRGHGIPWKGNYSAWLEQKEARLETENKQIDAHMKAMKQELEWGGKARKRASPYPVAETLDRREAVPKAKGVKVFARIGHAAEAQSAGMNLRPTQLLIFGNPKAGTPLMRANQRIGLDLPMKAWPDRTRKARCN